MRRSDSYQPASRFRLQLSPRHSSCGHSVQFVDAVDVVSGTCPHVADLVRTGLAEVALPAVALFHVAGDAEREVLALAGYVRGAGDGHA